MVVPAVEAHVCRVAMEKRALKGLIETTVGPPAKRKALIYLAAEHKRSVRHICRHVGSARAGFYRSPKDRDGDTEVIETINTMIEGHPRWCFWKTSRALRRKGHGWNHKRVYRLYCNLTLIQKRRVKNRLPERFNQSLLVPSVPTQVWSSDLMSDMLYSGKRFRTVNMIDDFNREAIHIKVDTSITGRRLIPILMCLRLEWGLPHVLRVDNRPQFFSVEFIAWSESVGMMIQDIQPGEQVYESRRTPRWCSCIKALPLQNFSTFFGERRNLPAGHAMQH